MLTLVLIAALSSATSDAPRFAIESRYTGGTLPDGMHLEQRPFRGLWVAGLSAFVIAYVPSAVASAVLGSWQMFIPVYGQVIALRAGQPPLNAFLFTADAVAEIAGLALFVAGLCIKMPYVVRNTSDWQFALVPTTTGAALVAIGL